ncbi:MAG: hypothetical protein ACI8S6_004805 [Myxococcota bacterium]|jgi:hypothetical protein
MGSEGRRARLSWLHQLRTGALPTHHTPLPTGIDPITVVGASLHRPRTITLTLHGGGEVLAEPPWLLPPVRHRLIVSIDPKTGALLRSWYPDDPGAGEGIEVDGGIIGGGLGLVCALPGGEVRCWALEDGAPQPHALPPLEEAPLLVSPDGALVLCGREVRSIEDGGLQLSVPASVRCALWDGAAGFLLTGGEDGVSFWVIGLPRPLQALSLDGGALAMAWGRDGSLLVVGRGGLWQLGSAGGD